MFVLLFVSRGVFSPLGYVRVFNCLSLCLPYTILAHLSHRLKRQLIYRMEVASVCASVRASTLCISETSRSKAIKQTLLEVTCST